MSYSNRGFRMASVSAPILLAASILGAHAAAVASTAEAVDALSGEYWDRLRAGVHAVGEGELKTAKKALRDASSVGPKALPRLLGKLLDAYVSTHRRAGILSAAADRSREVPEEHYRELLRLVRTELAREDREAPARELRALLCHTRLLAEDTMTDGERLLLNAFELGDEYTEPERIFALGPRYPPAARAAGGPRRVIYEVNIDSEGCVARSRLLANDPLSDKKRKVTGDHRLDRAAIETARLRTIEDPYGLGEAVLVVSRWWAFEPARLSGEPVGVRKHLVQTFRSR